ncbi:GH36-type glycosyl hydrolase domain-containing protein [Halobacillus sp. Marseille-P3879]|uniref:GH36-type glycosyl hydrolase domain-containing protein n=1 Tax=Halobacillus sp. Marseille-P3879 TaxID=2045014 RepID=UPI001F4919A3|nr:amylo-alpha-1,6-glucosidase [Halobacillus sp. Marseille-P3879]
MTLTKDSTITLTAGEYQFSFLTSGDLSEAAYKGIMINQLMTNPLDGSLNNLYLRVHRDDNIHAYPLLGINSRSDVAFGNRHAVWTGTVDDIHYEVVFHLTDRGVWFWDVKAEGQEAEIDIVYGQDLGVADKGALRNNEAYISQYLDHQIFEDEEKGWIVCSRQNQQQSTGFPYVQQGSLTRAAGYSTDGFQFFGQSYKETNQPVVLAESSLANEVYQYEFAYTALQSEKVKLSGEEQFIFYGALMENHEAAVSEPAYQETIQEAWDEVKASEPQDEEPVEKIEKTPSIGDVLCGESMPLSEIESLYPNRHQEEWDGDRLLSFFTDSYEHVVLKEKEKLVERPHGHIVMSGKNDRLKENTITSTSWMYGIFNAQLVVGNTNFNKLLTNARNALNILKTSGQRIYVEMDGTYQLLTMPSLYEVGFNYARWYYKTEDETFIITSYTTVDSPEVRLTVKAAGGGEYRYLVTNQVVMHPNEYEVPFHVRREGQTLTVTADETAMNTGVYPDLLYKIHINGATFDTADEQKLVTNVKPGCASLVVCDLDPADEWEMIIQGLLHGEDLEVEERSTESEIERYREYYRSVMNGFHLSEKGIETEQLNKVNALAWWYTHNMLVHFSVPHGLEQYSGAAWGTRDVCQGPMEYFMATQNYESVKEIIKTVYTHQFAEDGNWPQWFMFDKYSHIQAGESHGDIIVWPLKALSDYLTVTKDYQILQEKVPYTKRGDGFDLTEEKATIYEHAKKEINYIKEHFLHDTYLSSYGDGDWDDTLQPANAQLKQYMVSSWTVALTYQVVTRLADVLESFDLRHASELASLASGIEGDFKKYMLQTEVLPGFVYMEEPGEPELMLHPEDNTTGIDYRLLPMQRSIISELLTAEQAEQHYQIIKEKLSCPDGVRLMNRPAHYDGGVSTHFKRAEQASNFGREIGLQYVHAHIRFVEAMAKLGKKEEVWQGLQKINPINIQEVVPNAEIRQSNAYFSSSDGKFNTRYEAEENFGKLRDGSVAVKGGWRIYSSGPGIYMNQLISNCLGIRLEGEHLVIDPVLTDEFDGLCFDFQINDKPVTFVYSLGKGEKRVTINNQPVEKVEFAKNTYREGGFRIEQKELEQLCREKANVIEIFLP